MLIRLARPEDVAGILAISNRAAQHTAANFAVMPESLESWEASFRDTSERYPWFVAGDGAVVTGFAKASPWKGRCAYEFTAEITVYVHPDHHRLGLGRALYTRLFDTMKRQGYQTLIGGITLPNEASVRLHESFGMERCGVFSRVGWKFDRWHDVGYWQIVLRGDERPGGIRPVAEAVDRPASTSR
jgi:phosphinothricin acetyltransferase